MIEFKLVFICGGGGIVRKIRSLKIEKNRVVFITAPNIFRDEEYCKPKEVLEEAGIEVITASLKIGELIGRFGLKAKSTLLVEDVNPDGFGALVYIGGSGAAIFFDNYNALKLASDFLRQSKPVASICIAGVILAKAGILKNKKATVFIDGKESLVKCGAIYTGAPLEIDGNIITANGPDVAKDFGKAILRAFKANHSL